MLADLLVKVSELLPQLLKGGASIAVLLLALLLGQGCPLGHRAATSARSGVGISPAGAARSLELLLVIGGSFRRDAWVVQVVRLPPLRGARLPCLAWPIASRGQPNGRAGGCTWTLTGGAAWRTDRP